jgi:hypothetical protein
MGAAHRRMHMPQVFSERVVQPAAISDSHGVAIGEKHEHLARIPKAASAGYHRQTLRV